MERRSSKHGPRQDEALKRETAATTQGAPQRAHTEEWREVEPFPAAEGGGDSPIELRAELARVLTRDSFPADREVLLGRLGEADVPPALIALVARLPSAQTYPDVHAVLVELGINAPEGRR